MGTHKLLLDNDYGYDFVLIAIHTALEAYQVAFLINKSLGLHLVRSIEDLRLHKRKYDVNFSLFKYKDLQSQVTYHLLNNKARTTFKQENQGLFNNQNEVSVSELFLAELPKVDYLLKVTNKGNAFKKAQAIKRIKSISQIVMVYDLNIEPLKTKQNLIFE